MADHTNIFGVYEPIELFRSISAIIFRPQIFLDHRVALLLCISSAVI